MKKTIVFIIVIGLILWALSAVAWSGQWTFEEVCNDIGGIDVKATYTPSDDNGGTVQFTSEHLNLTAGAVVTANLIEDTGQASSYTVINVHDCTPPVEPTPPPSPTPNPPPPPPEEEQPSGSDNRRGGGTRVNTPPVTTTQIFPPPVQPPSELPRTGILARYYIFAFMVLSAVGLILLARRIKNN